MEELSVSTDAIQTAGSQLCAKFKKDSDVTIYCSNFSRFLRSFESSCPLAMHVCACMDPDGSIVSQLLKSPHIEAFNQGQWWVPLASRAFFLSLAREPHALSLALSSHAYRTIIIPFLFQQSLMSSSSSSSSSSSPLYPDVSPSDVADVWLSIGLLHSPNVGVPLFCQYWDNTALDMTHLHTHPLVNCHEPLVARQTLHVMHALHNPNTLGQFLIDKGARRDYLVLASQALLKKHVSLVEAAFLVQTLYRVWKTHESIEFLDQVGNFISQNLPALFLLRAVAPGGMSLVDWATLLSDSLAKNFPVISIGIMQLSKYCQEGEASARVLIISQIERTGYLGCLGAMMASAWTGTGLTATRPGAVAAAAAAAAAIALTSSAGSERLPKSRASVRTTPNPDEHRHLMLKRSGAHYIVGETVELDEDGRFEFKAVQLTSNVVLHISRIASKYVPAFLNSGGGHLLFGVEDDGRVVGIELNRGQRDAIRLCVDLLKVVPDCSHLVEVVFSPVLGALQERFVVELIIAPGELDALYCTKDGEHYIRRNGGICVLRGQSLVGFVQRRLKLAKGCQEHQGESLRYSCSCTSPPVDVCAICLLESHTGHIYIDNATQE